MSTKQTHYHFNCRNWSHHIQMFTNLSIFSSVLLFLTPDPMEQTTMLGHPDKHLCELDFPWVQHWPRGRGGVTGFCLLLSKWMLLKIFNLFWKFKMSRIVASNFFQDREDIGQLYVATYVLIQSTKKEPYRGFVLCRLKPFKVCWSSDCNLHSWPHRF